jgi:outer membrane protein
MNRLLISASLAGVSMMLPSVAQAQAIPAAQIVVVDLDKVTTACNACRTAQTALRDQAAAQQGRETSLVAPLTTEQKSIQAAVDALNGKAPDAALQARAKAFQTRYQQAQEQAARGRAQLEANQTYIRKQIADKLGPIYSQVMQRRGANLMVEIGTTLASASALDVSNDVVAALNAALPTIQTTAPVPQQPQGR